MGWIPDNNVDHPDTTTPVLTSGPAVADEYIVYVGGGSSFTDNVDDGGVLPINIVIESLLNMRRRRQCLSRYQPTFNLF